MIMKYSRIAPAYYYQVICVAVQSVCIFLEGIYLYVHGDANAFVLRKINSILMRKLTSQIFSNFFFRIDWEQHELEIGHFERHEIDIVVHYYPQDGPSRPSCQGNGKNLEKALQLMTTGKAKSIPYCAARLGFHHNNGQRPQTHFIGVFSKVGFSFERSFLAPQPVCSLCDEQTR